MKNFFIILLTGLFTLITFEFYLTYSPFGYGTSAVEYDSNIGMWHRLNYTGKTIKECYNTQYMFDSRGLVKSTYTYDKSKKDVLIFGDSFIEAIMIRNENIIHNALADQYKHKYNFLNYGLSDTCAVQQYSILKHKADLTNAKYVVQFVNLDSDLYDVDSKSHNALRRPRVYMEFKDLDNFQIIPPRSQTFYDKAGDLLGNFQIYFYLKKIIFYINDTYLSEKKVNTPLKNVDKENTNLAKNWLYLEGAIHQTKKYMMGVNSNIKYKLIIISDKPANKQIIEKFLKSENIEYVFINDVFKKKNVEVKVFKCDGHWTDETHQNTAYLLHSIGFLE